MTDYYLGGPMSGLPEYNFPRFEHVSKDLRAAGLRIYSAHEVDYGETPKTRGSLPYSTYIKGDLKLMLQCDAVIFLERWRSSKGCSLEFGIAESTGMKVYELEGVSTLIRIL